MFGPWFQHFAFLVGSKAVTNALHLLTMKRVHVRTYSIGTYVQQLLGGQL